MRQIEGPELSLDWTPRMKIIIKLVRSGDDEDPYDPLSDADRALLSDRYRRDIERIGRMGVTCLG
jgi:hypothetical protein